MHDAVDTARTVTRFARRSVVPHSGGTASRELSVHDGSVAGSNRILLIPHEMQRLAAKSQLYERPHDQTLDLAV